jgi:CO/xanthine dehydrogenase Mo-binding subunit
MYVVAMDMKAKLTDLAAQILGGAADDYDIGDEKVISKKDPKKTITYAQAVEKAMQLGGKYTGQQVPDNLNPITKSSVAMIAGTGLIAAAKDTLPRVGTTPGLVTTFSEIELDLETGKVEVKDMFVVADCGTVLHPMGLHHTIACGQVMGIGMAQLERHIYDPKLGIPAAAMIHQSKPPTYLDVPIEVQWAAVEKPDPSNPMGVKGTGEPVKGAGASSITSAISDALGGHLFNRTPVSVDMIVNHLAGRPQAHKPLQINTV